MKLEHALKVNKRIFTLKAVSDPVNKILGSGTDAIASGAQNHALKALGLAVNVCFSLFI